MKYFKAIEYLEFDEGICGLVAQERRQIVVNDVPHSTHPHANILMLWESQPMQVNR